jgi:ribonuclease P protein component
MDCARVSRRGESQYRLSGAAAFTRIFGNGRRFKGRFVQIIINPGENPIPPHLPSTRYGIVVGRKVLPRAVDRNRFKRKVRVLLRTWRNALSGFEILVLAGKMARDTINAAVAEVEQLLTLALPAQKPDVAHRTKTP